MINKIHNFLNRANSYAQYGEDKIILLMLDLYNIKNASYIDIGAHHPFKYSNSALLSLNGINGINIEPDPYLFKKIIKYRKKDINLNIGLQEAEGESTLFQFERPEFNTFSEIVAHEIMIKGIKKIGEKRVRINTYNNVVEKYLDGKAPDIVLIDTEGFDEIILKSIDYEKFSPKIICVETYTYGVGKKNCEIINFLLDKNYSIHADTFVNTIFIKSTLAKNVLSFVFSKF
jgi:FkbM family methyltransferase